MFSKTRLFAATALAGLLIAGGAVAPASAATGPLPGATAVVTITGHVTDPDGKPITGIEAFAACPCAVDHGPHQADKDLTSATGYYSLRVQKQYASTLYFSDPKHRYFGKTGKLRATASGYRANATLKRVSVVSGTVTAVNGARAHFTTVQFFDATTGKGRGGASAHADGTYTARIHPGSYKVRFGGGPYTNQVWYGGAATSAESPTVTVGYGGTVTGIDATVTPKPTISGTITVDGKQALDAVRERVAVTIVDSSGVQVDKTVVSSAFSLTDLTPGDYTIQVRATNTGVPYVQPLDRAVTLLPGTAIRGLTLDLTSTPPTTSTTRTSAVEFFETSTGIARAGKVLKGKIVVSSYGVVKGGTVLIYVNGTKVDSRILPASGRINWRFRPAKVIVGGPHPFRVTAHYLGTATTRPRFAYIYALGGD